MSQEDRLPAVPAGTDVEPEVIDGQVVDESGPVAVVSARTVTTPPAARLAARHVAYVVAGVVVAWKRWRLARTRHERMARSAELSGDHETALRWVQQRELEREQRSRRRADMIRAVAELVKVSPLIGAALLVVMVLTGVSLAVVRHRVADIAWPWLALFHAVALAVEVASVAWLVASIAGPVALVLALHHLGRHAGDLAPRWAVSAKTQDADLALVVTADTIVLALQHVPIAPLKQAFKDGWKPAFHTLPVRDGEGYTAVFPVPLGVTAAMIADQQEILARNLQRAKTEVWATDAERGGIAPAGHVAMWVANPGVLDRPAPEYPLLHDGTADVFRGVPAGVSPRGDAISIPVVGNNFVVGGIMGQGKSNACRVLMLGAALDPLAELWVHVFAYNADFDAYRPRLARYVKGAEDEHIAAAMATLHELYAEVTRREKRLEELGALKVTRNLALRCPDMRPRLALFSECHELFGHRGSGAEATEVAVAVIRKARKTAIWMGFDTQDARKDAIPPKIVGLVSVNACFAVKTWRANDGFLGDGSFQAGIRATELRPGRDVGRSLITGVSDAQFELLKWHYIRSDDEKGTDEAAPVIARAVTAAAPGTAIGGSATLAIEARDLLADLGEVIKGTERVKLRDVVGLLRGLSPSWYRSLTATQLRADLEDEGVKTVNTSGTHYLDPAELRPVLAERGE